MAHRPLSLSEMDVSSDLSDSSSDVPNVSADPLNDSLVSSDSSSDVSNVSVDSLNDSLISSDDSSDVSNVSVDPLNDSLVSSNISSGVDVPWHLDKLPSDAVQLFKATGSGDVHSLRAILNNSSNSSQLLLKADRYGYTTLHRASNRDIAEVLVEFVEPTNLKEFLWVTGEPQHFTVQGKWTALDKAVANHRADVVKYLCDLTSADESLLDGHLLAGHQPLIVAGSGKLGKKSLSVAKTLVESVPTDKQSILLFHTIARKRTALHIATGWGHDDVAEYLCGLATALNIADELLYAKDQWGRTALHYASTEKRAQLLINTAQNKLEYINTTDDNGNTAVMHMTIRGCVDSLDCTLQNICSELGVSDIKYAILMTNKSKQNIFHLACFSPLVEDLYEVLEEYLDWVKVEDLFTADVFNNTPFTYLAARFSPRLFAQFIFKFPLWQRRTFLLQPNQMQTNCVSIFKQKEFQGEFFMKRILCCDMEYEDKFYNMLASNTFRLRHLYSPQEFTKYDLDTFRIMKYALNEYSLLDSHVPTLPSSKQSNEQEQTEEKVTGSTMTPPIMHISHFDANKLTPKAIQQELYKLDVTDMQSEPKVVVVRYSTSDLVRYLSPPGPDFIIITLVSVHSASDMFSDLQTKSFGDIEELLGYLKRQEIVKYININSTMARHYGSSSTEPADDHVLLSGDSKGKALIICSRSGREKWEVEHGHACRVMEQLGLQVQCLYDKSADDILAAISGFSKSSGHGSLTALCIMSHGDLRGNISGDGDKGLCSVQQVVDALCQPDIQSVTKMIFLSYCRGPAGMPTCNRTNDSWETKKLKFLASTMLYNPILKGVNMHVLNSVRASHPFPSVDVPENCYICYATLPDSTSLLYKKSGQKTDQMFVSLSDHLSNIYRCCTLYNKRKVAKPADNSATDCVTVDVVFDTSALERDISITEQVVATSTQQQLPRVELIPLLIDVTAITREKSEFTQYMNYCYVVTKEYKPIVLEILPINVSTDIHVLSTK